MFATIKTNGAHTIVIAIPHEGSDRSLPALATMLEQNAVFISSPGWQTNAIIKPEMTIHLGDGFEFQSKDETIMVTHSNSEAVIADEWQRATPEVFASNRKKCEEYEARLKLFSDEITSLRFQLEQAKAARGAANESDDEPRA
jgi:uncharacterized small protein (DUF1192 family)